MYESLLFFYLIALNLCQKIKTYTISLVRSYQDLTSFILDMR